MAIGDKHYVHDSLIQTLRLRDTLAVCGEEAAAAAAHKLADILWALTRPTKVTKPAQAARAEHEAVMQASGAAQVKDDAPGASDDPRNPFEDHDHLVARAADGAPTGAATDTDVGNPFEGL